MSTIVTPYDMTTYLGIPELVGPDVDRMQMLIDDAIAQALAIVTVGTVPPTGATEANLPGGAGSVIRAAVGRLFMNPTGVTHEQTGPYQVNRPAPSGSMFSTSERNTLRRMGDRSAAFTIDPLGVNGAMDATDYPWSRFPEITP